MSGRWLLVPMCMTLTLVGGCGASDESAQSGNDSPPAMVATAVAETPEPSAPPPAPIGNAAMPARPGPQVTVRAQPAPYFPLDLPPSDVSASADPFPREVTEFMVARDGCDHFRGEEPYDAERRAYIAENIAELCHGTDARLASLRRRYATEPSVIAALKVYDAHIEAPVGYSSY